MHRQIPWFERTFPLDHDVRLVAEIVARIAGAPARMRAMVVGVSDEVLTRQIDGTWSIQENIAHLADLDRILFVPRIEQFAAEVDVLLPADVTNATTNGARHNERAIGDVLDEFDATRADIVQRLDATDPARFALSALHERLGVQMRLMDLCVFIAEHDDSHAARVRELLAKLD